MDGRPELRKEVDLLSRVAVNHLFLGQYEPLRAALLSLRKRDPILALSFLRSVVLKGGEFDGVLWSSTCRSPAHLAWLAVLDLVQFEDPSCLVEGLDHEMLRLKVEFLLLSQIVCSNVGDCGSGEELSRGRWILELGLRGLKSGGGGQVQDGVGLGAGEVLSGLKKVVLEQAEIFDVLCWNIHDQVHHFSEPLAGKLAICVRSEILESSDACHGELETMVQIQRAIQLAHLDALKEDSESGDTERAISHIRYLHLDFGVDNSEYRIPLTFLIKKFWEQKDIFSEAQCSFQNKMLMVYGEAFSANCFPLLQIIQAIQDELLYDEQNRHIVSNGVRLPLSLQKYVEVLKLGSGLEYKPSHAELSQYCMWDLYHYCRISGSNTLECVMDYALSAVRREQLQEACYVLSLFPLLQPLVAAMGWDLLSGKTAARRKLLQILWTSKSQALRLEKFSLREKQSDEMSCVEYLCDLLCFHLDLASFVARANSGRDWNSKDSMLFSRKQQIADVDIDDQSDPFVENFVLERLAIQTPLRVLFDVVPGIKFQDAIELISMQPMNSTSVAWKRLQDIELIHQRYALESALLSLRAMERCGCDENEKFYREAIWHLKNFRNHLDAVSSIPRKVFMLSIIISLLLMDKTYVDPAHCAPFSSYSAASEWPDLDSSCDGENAMVVTFVGLVLEILCCNLPAVGAESDQFLSIVVADSGRQALEWRIANIKHFIEDWNWRLSILQKLPPLSGHPWSWKEALTVLRAGPSNLLNLCMQRAEYDIGEEAVHRFSLPVEDKVALELNEWVAGAFRRESVEDSVLHAAEGLSNAFHEIDFSSICSQLGPLISALLCIDIASTSAKSANMCLLLLDEASSILSRIYPGGSSTFGTAYWDQLKEVSIIAVIQRVLQRLCDLLEQEKTPSLQEIFAGEAFTSPLEELSRQEQRQRALALLHQMIDDAHVGKRQFLSGKLHNLARVVADEDIDNEPKKLLSLEKGAVPGLGLRQHTISSSAKEGASHSDYVANDTEKVPIGSLGSRLSTYISSFIIYIATIGDIVDGIDTTHDFNFFSLVYQWPKDLLNRLVFERGSTDAAAKIADIMCSDFVHEVISACVPPVLPPPSGRGWACIPHFPSLSKKTLENALSPEEAWSSSKIPFSAMLDTALYPLNLDIVKHLAKLSPVRAILACVFGRSIVSRSTSTSIAGGFNAEFVQAPDIERSFYEFSLDQSERFPTLNRWIQMQSNLHKVSESVIMADSDSEPKVKNSVKRSREPGSDTESDIDEMTGGHIVSTLSRDDSMDHATSDAWQKSKSASVELETVSFVSLDWENEEPYKKAVERLIDEGKLMDALALSDRFLRDGASDHLLQLLIENGDEISLMPGQSSHSGVHNMCTKNWQYCLRLKDKRLAARLALKYLRHWELNAALDVLTMSICHLPQEDPTRNEVWQMRQALEKYNRILCADGSHRSWQGVEIEYRVDPEGLALRLASKGNVSAALEVAESAALSIDLRRELQGQQLVKLLTADPLNGGGPAEASRFLSLLRDPDDALPVAMGAMQLLPDLRSKQLLVRFFLKRRAGNLSNVEVTRLNSWALGLHVLAVLPLPWQQRCSALHEHPRLILEVLLMMKQLQYASLIMKEFPCLRDDNVILAYSAKAISVNVCSSREPRMSVSGSRTRQKTRTNILSKTNLTSSLSNLHKEARKAFSWAPRDVGSKTSPRKSYHKRKSSGLIQSERVSWEAMSGIQEEHASFYSADGQERIPFVPVPEEWVLTGDSGKDDAIRLSHRYESAPDIVLFKGLLSLCSDELVSVRGVLDLCIAQMKNVLSSRQLPLDASMEAASQAYHATETFVQALVYAKGLLKKLVGGSDSSSNSERSKDMDDASIETSSSSFGSQFPDELSELQAQADFWLGRAELLQSLLGSGIVASLDDIVDKESSECLRDRLIKGERYSMAVYTSKKCKIDVFPVWKAWGHALIQMEHYAQARVKFKQALQLYNGSPSQVIQEIINTVEGGPPVDVSAVRSLYEHLAESAARILDDSLSADAYLNVLFMPSTFPRSERTTMHHDSAHNGHSQSSSPDSEDGPKSNLDDIRYIECIHYLQEYARSDMLKFMFRHGRYTDACLLFFPPNAMPLTQATSGATLPQRPDPMATDYGTIEDLCDFCIGYDAMGYLENILMARIASVSQDAAVSQFINTALVRICNYCETHRHFNFLYKFQVIKGDHVAAGLCCIQLFMNSFSLEEATKHLENSMMHFEEELSTRTDGTPKFVSSTSRGKSISGKVSEEGLIKFSACVTRQIDVIKSFTDTDGPPWKHSLFGNPNDPETFRRRCQIAEALSEKNFDMAFGVIYQFNLPAVDIYAGVASVLSERKRSNQLTTLFSNIRGTIDFNDWDQVLGAAINVYANKHKERPDKLIDMLHSSHRKVLACVVCGRLKSAFQIASRSGSVADVQYVAHQALHANALPVLELCKQWLSRYS